MGCFQKKVFILALSIVSLSVCAVTDEEREEYIRHGFETTYLPHLFKLEENPQIFISYAWGERARMDLVQRIGRDLKKISEHALLDIDDNPPGTRLTDFVSRVPSSKYVLLFGSEKYRAKWDGRRDYRTVLVEEADLIDHKKRADINSVLGVQLNGNRREEVFPEFMYQVVTLDAREKDYYDIFKSIVGILWEREKNPIEEFNKSWSMFDRYKASILSGEKDDEVTRSVKEKGLRGLKPLVERTIKIENIKELETFEGETNVTSLMRASFVGRIDLVRELLESEPESINTKTPKTKTTALMLAAIAQREEVAQHLLEKGADPSDRRNDGMNALILSGLKGEKETFQLIKGWMFEKIKELDPEHPEVGRTWGNIGNAYQVLGRYEGALAAHEKNLAIKYKTYGPEHPEVGRIWGNIGNAYKSLDRYEEAFTAHQKSLAIFEKTYGPDHPSLAITLGNIGVAYYALGRYEEAVQSTQKSVTILEKIHEDNHSHVKIFRNNLETQKAKLRNS